MKRKALVFGAGAIGLGFLGEILNRSGYLITYTDLDRDLVDELRSQRRYRFNLVGRETRSRIVEGVDAICFTPGSSNPEVVQQIAEAQVIFTSVGATALPEIASTIAQGLSQRSVEASPVNILVTENLADAAGKLAQLIGGPGLTFRNQVGIVNTVVSRMCKRVSIEESPHPPVFEGSHLVIEAEPEGDMIADASAVVGEQPEIRDVRFLSGEEFDAHRDRKVFAHNGGHALLTYLGALAGYHFVPEVDRDIAIRNVVSRALAEEIGPALIARYGRYFAPSAYRLYLDDLYRRMVSPDFNDSIERGIRNSLAKISGDDARLLRMARFVKEQRGTPRYSSLAIAAALILNKIEESEIEHILVETCGINRQTEQEMINLIGFAHRALNTWQAQGHPNLDQHLHKIGYLLK